MKLVQLVDSIQYATTNPWQKQLLEHLRKNSTSHHILTLQHLQAGRPLEGGDIIISTLKLRTLQRCKELLRTSLGGRKIFIYDQDPWEGFIDSGTCRGVYQWLNMNLNVGSYIVTSRWWADYLTSRGFKTVFAPMWLDSTLCDENPSWDSRPVLVGFMGAMHPYRKNAIAELERYGVHVTVFPPGSYDEYLRSLSQMKFFFHCEAGDSWTINGEPVGQNALWAKEIEIAGRGAFPLRQWEDEARAYHVHEIPGILPFNSLSEIPSLIEDSLQNDESVLRSRLSVQKISSITGWFQPSDLLSL